MHRYLPKEEILTRLTDANQIETLAIRNFRYIWQIEWWLYAAIRLRTASPWNHAVFLIHGTKYKTVYHIIGRGIVFEDYDEWLKAEHRTIESLHTPILLTIKTLTRIKNNRNAKYDYFKFILAAFGIPKGEITKAPFYCYELIAFILQLGNGPWNVNKLRIMICQLYFNSVS